MTDATPQAALLSAQNPLLKRCYTMSEPHLSGYRVVIGFERLEDAQDAHEYIAKLQATQEPVQAGELPEPDAVFYCSEDTGYLTQYRRPPANLTDGDVAMYEADTVRSLLISAALAARKPLTDEQRKRT